MRAPSPAPVDNAETAALTVQAAPTPASETSPLPPSLPPASKPDCRRGVASHSAASAASDDIFDEFHCKIFTTWKSII